MGNQSSENTLIDIIVAVVILAIAISIIGTFTGPYLDAIIQWYRMTIENVYSGAVKTAGEAPDSGSGMGIFSIIKALFIIFDALILVFIIFTIRRYTKLVKKPSRMIPEEKIDAHPVALARETREGWDHIRALANSHNPSDWNMAILRADALVDNVLQRLGHEGESFAERLAVADPTMLRSHERLWSAHRLRNAIAHDPLSQHSRETIIHALKSYEQSLKELGALQSENREEKKPPARSPAHRQGGA